MRFNFSIFILASIALFSAESHAQKRHNATGIEMEMGRDEQALVSRTLDNANGFTQKTQKKIVDLDKKIANSSGEQLKARKARREQMQSIQNLVDGCLVPNWNKIGHHRIGSAEAVDQLIRSLEPSLED